MESQNADEHHGFVCSTEPLIASANAPHPVRYVSLATGVGKEKIFTSAVALVSRRYNKTDR